MELACGVEHASQRARNYTADRVSDGNRRRPRGSLDAGRGTISATCAGDVCVAAAPYATESKSEHNGNCNNGELCEIITTIHFATSTMNRRI